MNQLTLFLGSLAAVLMLAGTAWALGLGGGGIESEAAAMTAAEEMLSGFEPVSAMVGEDGRAALVHGHDGSAALLKLHGARIAARRVHRLSCEAGPDGLRVDSGDPRFGVVVLRGVRSG